MRKNKECKLAKKDIDYYRQKLKDLELENALNPSKNLAEFEKRYEEEFGKQKKKRKKDTPKVSTKKPMYTSTTHSSSYGEGQVREYLVNNEIEYSYDHRFDDLINPKTGQYLFIDFYLPKLKTCIEFNGQQHYEYSPKFHGEDPKLGLRKLGFQKYKDNLKRLYCRKNDLRLIVIKYTKQEFIQEILKEKLNLG